MRLAEVALELFTENGFEQTTAAQIAAAAHVTERTFFNHFETKLDALFLREDYLSFQSLRDKIAGTDSPITTLDDLLALAISWMTDELSATPEEHHRTGRLRHQIGQRSPTVLSMIRAAHEHLATALAHGLAEHHGRDAPTPVDETLGIVAGALIDHAYARWLAQDDLDAFGDLATEDVVALRSALR
ncbi:TetR/AcrR family transcriptional regulator [Rhodococcus koreensis]